MDAIAVGVIVGSVFFAVYRLVWWLGNTWLIGREALRDRPTERS